MNNIKLLRFFVFVFFLLLNNLVISSVYSQITGKIIIKINDNIITTLDLQNEKKFLIFLNPNLNNLSKDKVESISLDSLKNRKIKEIELKNFINLDDENLEREIINKFLSNNNLNNKENLLLTLDQINLNYNYLKKNLVIDNIWREFIFNKFKSQVKVNIQELKKKLENQPLDIDEYNVSEILFESNKKANINELTNQIFEEINSSGFENAASIFSISESKNIGGKIGWVKSNQISEKILNEIKKGENLIGPIKINNGYLIIKINEKRKSNEEINLDQDLQKLIAIETQKELNKLGYIYFNKIKKRTFISEL